MVGLIKIDRRCCVAYPEALTPHVIRDEPPREQDARGGRFIRGAFDGVVPRADRTFLAR
jgi:hypothetical protein